MSWTQTFANYKTDEAWICWLWLSVPTLSARRPSSPAGTAGSPETLRPSGPFQPGGRQTWRTPHGALYRSSQRQRASITTEQIHVDKMKISENMLNKFRKKKKSSNCKYTVCAVENLERLLLFLDGMRFWRWTHSGDVHICHSCSQELKHRRFETGMNPSIHPTLFSLFKFAIKFFPQRALHSLQMQHPPPLHPRSGWGKKPKRQNCRGGIINYRTGRCAHIYGWQQEEYC